MKRYLFFWLTSVCSAQAMHVATVAPSEIVAKRDNATRTLLVFVDSQEKASKIGLIASSAIAALLSQAAPVLLSSGLLHEITKAPLPPLVPAVQRRFDLIKETIEAYKKKHPDAARHMILANLEEAFAKSDADDGAEIDPVKLTSHTATLALALFRREFNRDAWWVKEINHEKHGFCFLMPKKYLETCRESLSAELGRQPTDKQLEIVVGISTPAISGVVTLKDDTQASPVVAALRQIFLPKNVYGDGLESVQPQWAVYAEGHGSTGKIAGLTTEDFRSVLQFFEKEVQTKLFFYTSCYAAGVNAEKLFKEEGRRRSASDVDRSQYQYSYPVVIENGVDMPSFGLPVYVNLLGSFSVEDIDAERAVPKVKIEDWCNFGSFVSAVEKQASTINVAALVKSLRGRLKYMANTPQLLVPGRPWLYSVDIGSPTHSITRVTSRTRQDSLSFDDIERRPDTSLIKKPREDLGTFCLYSHYVPFSIVLKNSRLEKKKDPIFVSSIAGPALHKIKTVCFDGPLAAFFRKQFESTHVEYNFPKFLWIKNMYAALPTADEPSVLIATDVFLNLTKREVAYTDAAGDKYAGTSGSITKISYHYIARHRMSSSPEIGAQILDIQDKERTIKREQCLAQEESERLVEDASSANLITPSMCDMRKSPGSSSTLSSSKDQDKEEDYKNKFNAAVGLGAVALGIYKLVK